MHLQGTTLGPQLCSVLSHAVFLLIKKLTAVALNRGWEAESLRENVKYMHSPCPSPDQFKQNFWWWGFSTPYKLPRECLRAPKGEKPWLIISSWNTHTHWHVNTASVIYPGDAQQSACSPTHLLTHFFPRLVTPTHVSGPHIHKQNTPLGARKDQR